MLKRTFGLLALAALACAQSNLAPGTEPFISFHERIVALMHVRVIDGTGAPPLTDQTVVIDNGRITALGGSSAVEVPEDVRKLDMAGYTVIPGLIGMHEHLFYPSGGGLPLYNEQAFSAPRLYLAAGVTSMRTGGSLEPYTDLNVKRQIDGGLMPGPKIDATGPYIQGPGGYSIQMPSIATAQQARSLVDYWAAEGSTSFKAYMNISHDALAEAVRAAHAHHYKLTGHLCSVGFTEAAELGIDNLEHGFIVDTEFDPGKQRDVCPPQTQTMEAISKLGPDSPEMKRLFQSLVSHHVAITSTLAVFEAFLVPGQPPLQGRVLAAMSPVAAESFLESKERTAEHPNPARPEFLKKEMQLERAFVAAGGLLMAGCDPTGNGGALPGFGDQRNIELLVEAGFTPEEAIRIYTLNAATFQGTANRVGSIATGKQADLVIIDGDPASNIADIEKVKYVFKDGVPYDPVKLMDSVRGSVGTH
jgi:imidazolonepropionase-like amidohydrolase